MICGRCGAHVVSDRDGGWICSNGHRMPTHRPAAAQVDVLRDGTQSLRRMRHPRHVHTVAVQDGAGPRRTLGRDPMTDSPNTEPRRAVTGDEADAYSPIYRRWYRWRPGERAAIKRRTKRRERRDDAQQQAHDDPTDDLMDVLVRISQGPHPNPGDQR